jgi:Uma2 family endonuclease
MIAVPHYVSPNEYLAIDRDSTVRHEYRRGLVYAMAGGSTAHARIAVNLVSLSIPICGVRPVGCTTVMSRSIIKTSFIIIPMRQ